MGVDHVEFVIRVGQIVHVCDLESYVARPGGLPGLVKGVGDWFDGRDRSRRDEIREIGRDRPWAAADIEHRQPGPKVRDEIAR